MCLNNLISVIIPVYNREKDLMVAVQSVFEQTYKPLEIIIIDDHSSVPVDIRELQNTNPIIPVIYIRNRRNLGAAKSRNIGIQQAKGNLIAFLDSDDYWLPKKLELQTALFDSTNDLDVVYCDQLKRNGSNILPSNKILINNDLLKNLLKGWTAPNTSTLLIKREFLLRVGMFDENLTSCQDHDLWFKVATSNSVVNYVSEPLSVFVTSSEGRISYNYDKRLSGVETFLQKWKRYQFPQTISSNDFKNFMLAYYVKAIGPIFYEKIKKGHFFDSLRIYINYFIINKYFYKRLILRKYH